MSQAGIDQNNGGQRNRIGREVRDRLLMSILEENEVLFLQVRDQFLAAAFHSDGNNDEIDFGADLEFVVLGVGAECGDSQEQRRNEEQLNFLAHNTLSLP